MRWNAAARFSQAWLGRKRRPSAWPGVECDETPDPSIFGCWSRSGPLENLVVAYAPLSGRGGLLVPCVTSPGWSWKISLLSPLIKAQQWRDGFDDDIQEMTMGKANFPQVYTD